MELTRPARRCAAARRDARPTKRWRPIPTGSAADKRVSRRWPGSRDRPRDIGDRWSPVMHDSTARFGSWSRCMATVVIAAGWSVVASAQDAVPAHVGAIRAGGDALESTLMAKTALAVDQLPRKLAVQRLAES